MFEILLVEDDDDIREVITDYFTGKEEKLMNVTEAEDGETGLKMLYENKYDLVLLDIMLPGENGFELCKYIRSNSDIPVIFITARTREEDILYGYDLGCDDYVVKPFRISELYAKVKVLINRSKGMILNKELLAGKIKLDPHRMNVICDRQQIELAYKEYLILKILIENKNKPVSRENLMTHIWGYEYDGNERVLDNHIKKLRKALGPEGSKIKTVIRYGYKIID